jgi:hypothetical protein
LPITRFGSTFLVPADGVRHLDHGRTVMTGQVMPIQVDEAVDRLKPARALRRETEAIRAEARALRAENVRLRADLSEALRGLSERLCQVRETLAQAHGGRLVARSEGTGEGSGFILALEAVA